MRDIDIRKSVWRHLEKQHAGDDDTLMLDELGLLHGSTRIDIAVINGEIEGYELKSESDTLQRLPAQRDVYNRILDRVNLVVACNHFKHSKKLVPDWWGLTIAHWENGEVKLESVRENSINPQISLTSLCSLLWKDEALEILKRYGAVSGVKSKSREEIYKRLSEAVMDCELKREVRSALKCRQFWRSDRRSQQYDGLHQS